MLLDISKQDIFPLIRILELQYHQLIHSPAASNVEFVREVGPQIDMVARVIRKLVRMHGNPTLMPNLHTGNWHVSKAPAWDGPKAKAITTWHQPHELPRPYRRKDSL